MNLSYEEARAYAISHYEQGGDVFVECWNVEHFDAYVKEFGALTKGKLKRMFRIWDEQYKQM